MESKPRSPSPPVSLSTTTLSSFRWPSRLTKGFRLRAFHGPLEADQRGELGLNILYLGTNAGTSGQRKEALVRLGHEVTLIDPFAMLPPNRLVSLWLWRTGALGLAEIVRRRVLQLLSGTGFDVAWVDHGELISARTGERSKSADTRGALLQRRRPLRSPRRNALAGVSQSRPCLRSAGRRPRSQCRGGISARRKKGDVRLPVRR